MKILLSPAKTIQNVQFKGATSNPCFDKECIVLVNKIKKLSISQLKELMHVSEDIAVINYERYKNWSKWSNNDEIKVPAIMGFNGELYKGFDAMSLKEDELSIAQHSIRILSGLYGVLKPLDLIHPYRLEMGLKWVISLKHKNLYSFWGDKITDYINKELNQSEILINLASNEYFKAVNPKKISHRIVTPVFKEFSNGSYKTVMMYAKHERGAMARYIVQKKLEDVEDLKLYSENRYQYDVNQSSDNEWVFVR